MFFNLNLIVKQITYTFLDFHLGLFHFQKRTGGDLNYLGGGVPTTTIQFCWHPYLHILNSILLRNTLCHHSSHILIDLIPPIPHYE